MLQPITKENFQQMLGRFSTTELEGLIEKFPSFQQAYVLLAKKYQQENNPKFDQQLQLAALYVHDHEMLFSLFNDKDFAQSLPEQKSFFEEKAGSAFSALQTNLTQIQEIETEKIPEPQPVFETEKETSVANNAPAETFFEESTDLASSAVETDILQIEEIETEIVPDAEIPLIENVKETPAETFSVAEPHSFEDWLKAFSQTGPSETRVVKAKETDDELNRIITENTPGGYLQELVEEETHYSKGLDKFIEEQIEKHRYETAPPLASENDLAPELITETMAKVYEMQKKYAKAIWAYEILTLKYPEKSSFFAVRINELKKIS